MSIGPCISGLEQEGKLDADRAAQARALYDELLADYAATGSRETAEALASEAVLGAMERQVERKTFLAARTVKVRGRIEADLRGYNGGGEGPIAPQAGPAVLDHDPKARFSNVEARRKAVLSQSHRLMDRVLAEHSADLRGKVRGKAQLRNITRELFGEETGDATAKELAAAWRRTAEMLRQRYNAAGGEIGFRADWGLPQSHDWRSVRKAGYEAWRDFILPRLDPEKMIDQRTGRPFTRAKLEEVLPEIWDGIRTNGWDDRTPGSPGAKALANRRADARFFVFRNANAWAEYAESFGSGTAYDAMMGHMEGMARDIAALEILGPNPAATLEWMKGTIEKSAATDQSAGSRAVHLARRNGARVDRLWDEYRGANLEPYNERIALFFSSWRAIATATKLGSATLSATSDFAFQASRRAMNGLSNRMLLPDYLKLMRPGSIEDQKLAVRRGLIAEEWAGRTAAQSRYLMEELTGEVPRRLAEAVLRLSLLSRHTQAMRWVYGMETLATYTEQAGRSFDALDPKLAGALQRYGIDAADWEKIRSAPMETDRGAEWISPHLFEDQELASRFLEMIHSETDLAVPVADLRTRADLSTGPMSRGHFIGEFVKSAFLFKSFGLSVMLRQWQEMMAMTPAVAARYAAGLVIGTTLAGAAANQLKALAGGRDPRPMADAEFWGASMLQGGGFGIFGDFLYSAQGRTGSGFKDVALGPLWDDTQSVINLANAKNPERSVVREAKGFIPGNNLWYTRLAFDRMLADQIQQAVDPDYAKSWKRMERYAAEQGTSYFWQPGAMTPGRDPDFANALQEGPEQ